jgi:hypothetical protein
LSFTKLFSSLTESTLWVEQPHHVRIVWITMLAMADRDGMVAASIPGLARRACVTVSETEEALKVFLSPDKYSRTPDFEGRRIREVMGGWELLNHAKYRAAQSEEQERERKREWARTKRSSAVLPLSLHATKVDESRQSSSASASGSESVSDLDPDSREGVVDLIGATVSRLGPFDDANEMHDGVVSALREVGFECTKEYPIETPVVSGRIDILATRSQWRVGLELDWVTPRGKSLIKLLESDFIRIVVLRDAVKELPTIPGIDRVFGVISSRHVSEPYEPLDGVTLVNLRKGRLAPAELQPTEAQRVRCQELRFDADELMRDFKLQEFNRDYTDWERRYSKWIEDQKVRRETEAAKAKASPSSQVTRSRGFGQGVTPPLVASAKHVAFAKRYGIELDPIVNGLVLEGVVDSLGLGRAKELIGERLSAAARKAAS